jgi:hypothetical protein
MSDPEHLLPSQIVEHWLERTAVLEAPDAEAIMKLVRTYLPPPNAQALFACHPWYRADYPGAEMVDRERLAPSIQVLELERSNPRMYKSHYPLHAAANILFPDATNQSHRAARLVLTGLFADPPGENARRYYEQLLAVRHCISRAIDTVTAQCWHWRTAGEAFRCALNGRKLDDKTLQDLQCFQQLLNGQRKVGVNVQNQSPGENNETQRKHQRNIEAVRNRLNAAPRPPSEPREREPSRRAASDDGSTPRIGASSYQSVSPSGRTSGAENADPDGPTRLKRTQPSALTPADDRAQVRQQARIAATDILPAATDPQTLPFGRIHEALEAVADADALWALAWLTLTTAMPPQRLALLRAASRMPRDHTPHWNGQRLSYRLESGPAPAGGDGDNLVVVLTLPESVRHALTAIGGDQPLAHAAKSLDNRWSHAFRDRAGTVPTLMRMRATAELRNQSHIGERAAALALSGRYSFGHRAPGAYRRFEPGELQSHFERANTTMASSLFERANVGAKLAYRLNGLRFSSHPPRRASGSGRALPPDRFGQLFQSLQEVGTDMGAQLLEPGRSGATWTEVLQQLVRLQAAMTYLMWSLATGARPVADKTVFIRADKGVYAPHQEAAYLSDKASKSYRERRFVPVIDALAKQLNLNHEACRIGETLLRRRGWSVEDSRPTDRQDLAAYLALGRGGVARWRVYRQADFAADLRRAAPDAAGAIAPNAARHTVASELRRTLSEAHVDTLLGHARINLDLLAPASSAAPDWRALRQALQALLERTSIQPRTIKALYHVG